MSIPPSSEPPMWYVVEVQQGGYANAPMYQRRLNEMRQAGYQLVHSYDQHGNFVSVYEWRGTEATLGA